MIILVTGANGQLGRALRSASAGSADKYIWTDVAELDITDADAVAAMIAAERVDLVVNCAAYTNVDAAESDVEAARRLNTDAPGILAQAAREAGAAIIHISTDYVFGGSRSTVPYGEDMVPAPLGVYGETKLDGEREVVARNPRHIIIRTAWLYSETGRNFVRTMLDLTSRLPQVKVVFDQVGTPTYAADLARAIVTIIGCRGWDSAPGIYHYSDEGICSWFDLAHRVARVSGHASCRVQPCHSSEYSSPVKRPEYSVLDKSKIKQTFGVDVPYWTDSLDICVANLQEKS